MSNIVTGENLSRIMMVLGKISCYACGCSNDRIKASCWNCKRNVISTYYDDSLSNPWIRRKKSRKDNNTQEWYRNFVEEIGFVEVKSKGGGS